MDPIIRTSQSDPLQIASISVGRKGGALGLTSALGRQEMPNYGVSWQRDLSSDVETVKAWGAHYVVTLLEDSELLAPSILELQQRVHAAGLRSFWLPIAASAAPDDRFLVPWTLYGLRFARDLSDGYRIVIHSKEGLGRAGMVAALLFRNLSMAKDAGEAVRLLHTFCPNADINPTQVAFLRKSDRRRRN